MGYEGKIWCTKCKTFHPIPEEVSAYLLEGHKGPPREMFVVEEPTAEDTERYGQRDLLVATIRLHVGRRITALRDFQYKDDTILLMVRDEVSKFLNEYKAEADKPDAEWTLEWAISVIQREASAMLAAT